MTREIHHAPRDRRPRLPRGAYGAWMFDAALRIVGQGTLAGDAATLLQALRLVDLLRRTALPLLDRSMAGFHTRLTTKTSPLAALFGLGVHVLHNDPEPLRLLCSTGLETSFQQHEFGIVVPTRPAGDYDLHALPATVHLADDYFTRHPESIR